ncbi:hypothetical protein GJU95_07315 [Lactobacillus johnsonii]|uniref:Uncharacterized protein n=1 Tax=Lactobacillus johnsonii TaxID=33959 RepID=A0A9X5ALS9_LACJH|nr:hypothetical protein [Lactobacillus johnsonii]
MTISEIIDLIAIILCAFFFGAICASPKLRCWLGFQDEVTSKKYVNTNKPTSSLR